MAFDGDLESLPITDLIQLLHATGKSGTLTLHGPKGASQLVFDAGYIVSANHVNNSMRIGRILVDMGALTAQALEGALKAQAAAGPNRVPLVAALLEAGTVLPAQAYKGLEILIELTIVEVLTWSQGTFSFDVTKTFVSDEYRYFPEKLDQQIHLSTQSVLMDALRIYDERKRDGTLMDATFFGADDPEEAETTLSLEDLGLDALDELDATPTEPFHGLVDREGTGALRQLVRDALPAVSPEEGERLVRYLEGVSREPLAAPPVFLLTRDALTHEAVRHAASGALAGSADREEELAALPAAGAGPAVLLVGADVAAADELTALLERLRRQHDGAKIHLLLPAGNHRAFARALQTGIAGVVPWIAGGSDGESAAGDLMASCDSLRHLLVRPAPEHGPLPAHFLKLYREMAQLGTPAEITLSLLRFVAGFLPRAVTLVQLRGELVAEKGIGFGAPGAVSTMKLRIPLDVPSLLGDAARGGELYYGEADALIRESLAPASSVLLLPVLSMGRVAAVLYADWGDGSGAALPLPLLQVMAQHAGLVLDNALYRKRVAQAAPRG